MLIDDISIPEEIDSYYRSSLSAMPDSDFIHFCRALPALLEGLNQKSPNVKTLRERVSGKLEGKSVPGPVLALLREATLSERLFAALSTRAIRHGGDDWVAHFGAAPYIGSLLLDDREEIRSYARESWPRLSRKPLAGSTVSGEAGQLSHKFAPLLDTLRDLPKSPGDKKPSPVQPPPTPHKFKLSHEEETKLIEGSTLVKRLKREAKETASSLASKEADLKHLQSREMKAVADLKAAHDQLGKLQEDWDNSVARGVRDALMHRLGAWVQPFEVLAESTKSQQTALEKAATALKKQAQIDARYGTVSRLHTELSEAVNLKEQLQEALRESLRPLPDLQDAIASLDLKINEINSTLKRGSIAPDTERLEAVARRLNSAKSIEAALAIKSAVTSDMVKEVWSHNESTKALELIHRCVLNLYAQQGQRANIRREDIHKIAPLETLRQCLFTAAPCWILVDGHNVLHQVKPFIGGQYFDRVTGPNARARALLIEKLRTLVDLHPNISCDLYFDGPEDTQWGETERLKVQFSGGQGPDRADARILESLQSLKYRGIKADYIVVSDDRSILKQAVSAGAVDMSPIEFWMGFLAT